MNNDSTFLSLRRAFKAKLDEYKLNKSKAILNGSCEPIPYKVETAKLNALDEAYLLFLDALRDVTKEGLDDDEDEDFKLMEENN